MGPHSALRDGTQDPLLRDVHLPLTAPWPPGHMLQQQKRTQLMVSSPHLTDIRCIFWSYTMWGDALATFMADMAQYTICSVFCNAHCAVQNTWCLFHCWHFGVHEALVFSNFLHMHIQGHMVATRFGLTFWPNNVLVSNICNFIIFFSQCKAMFL